MYPKCATGKDFDRLNDMAARSRLADLVALAGVALAGDAHQISPYQTQKAIDSRSYFIMQVW